MGLGAHISGAKLGTRYRVMMVAFVDEALAFETCWWYQTFSTDARRPSTGRLRRLCRRSQLRPDPR